MDDSNQGDATVIKNHSSQRIGRDPVDHNQACALDMDRLVSRAGDCVPPPPLSGSDTLVRGKPFAIRSELFTSAAL